MRDHYSTAWHAGLDSDCECGLLRHPMSIFKDCERGGREALGVELCGEGWRLLAMSRSIIVYCGRCGRKDPTCDTVDLRPWLLDTVRRAARRHGWLLGELLDRTERFSGLRVFAVAPIVPDSGEAGSDYP